MEDAFRSAVARDPRRTLIAVDFDGTLAEIVGDPAAARPITGAGEVLGRLSRQLGEVAVVSGRPLEFLLSRLGDQPMLTLVGLYGLESRRGGRVEEHPEAGPWRERVRGAIATLEPELPTGVTVEDKGTSATVHYRAAPDREAEVRSLVERAGSASGLEVRPAKMSVELHPPLHVDKGTVLVDLADLSRVGEVGGGPVCFVGDDVGDLTAFDALDRLASTGRPTLRVAVAGPETPDELLGRADVVVDGPVGAARLLAGLVA
jgi:trehalose 6-phosphate phosphatase